MGRYVFRLPDIGEGVAEAEITVWHVKPGDAVTEDQSLVDVMTDKATIDMTSPVDGVVLAIHGEAGDMKAVGSPLVELEIEGDGEEEEATQTADVETAAPVKEPADKPADVVAAAAQLEPPTSNVAAAFATRAGDEGPLAAPATRRRAFELGVPLQFVPGTGPGGRITEQDLDAYIASGGSVGGLGGRPSGGMKLTGVTDTKIIGLRRKIADRMQDAKQRIPHIAYVEEFDMTELERLRAAMNVDRKDGQPKLTLLPFFIRALVALRPEFPQINSHFDDAAGLLHSHEGVHVGVATQTPTGLMVPVVRHAEALDLWACAAEIGRVTQAAREGKAAREELSGSTITITSLGTLGGIMSTPVINSPEVAIIAPNKLVERPVIVNGQIAIRKMMNLSGSFDHRIVDGYDAASFVQRMKRLIETPALLFVDTP